MTHWREKVVLLSALLLLTDTAWAVRYELKKGEQYALCHDYVEALNAAHRKLPMACERYFLPEFKRFSKPKWEPMDPKAQPMSFWRQMYDIQQRVLVKDKNTDEGWLRFKKNVLETSLDNNGVDIAKARVDIDFSGEADTLIRVRIRFGIGGCEAETEKWFRKGEGYSPQEYHYYVVNQETGNLDARYGRFALVGGGTHQGLFYYEGRAYLDSFIGISVESKLELAEKFQFRSVDDPEGHIEIQEPGGGTPDRFGVRDVCRVKVFYELSE